MKTALFPGTFDPFTIGHADIVSRALRLFDKVIVAIGVNENKVPFQSLEKRTAAIQTLYKGDARVEICAYTGLTIDAAKQHGANFLLRGVRSMKDFEYERDIADINFRLSGIETVFLFCKPELATVSSSLVRELHHFGRDISDFLPQAIQ